MPLGDCALGSAPCHKISNESQLFMLALVITTLHIYLCYGIILKLEFGISATNFCAWECIGHDYFIVIV